MNKAEERTFVPPEHPPEDDRGYQASQRAPVFVLLGPVFGALAQWSIAAVLSGGHAELYVILPAYLFSLIVCAITGPVDGILTCIVPIWWRAPLTAAVGAAVAVGVFFVLAVLHVGVKGYPPWSLLIVPALVGAVATGMSSLAASVRLPLWRKPGMDLRN